MTKPDDAQYETYYVAIDRERYETILKPDLPPSQVMEYRAYLKELKDREGKPVTVNPA